MLGVLLMVVPLVGAVAIALSPSRAAKGIALVATLAGLGIAILAAIDFSDWGTGGWGLEYNLPLLPAMGISLALGADSVSMLLMLLTTLLMPLAILGSWTAVSDRLREYYGWLLLLSTAMIGVFPRSRSSCVLHLLRVHTRADVFLDCNLRQHQSCMGEFKVLHLHIPWFTLRVGRLSLCGMGQCRTCRGMVLCNSGPRALRIHWFDHW